MRYLMLLVMVLAVSLPLAACGKKGEPKPPPGTESDFPRKYPSR
ncbi:MAG: putative small lipoprotein YifL [Alphaproteobacteria bacterium]|jgi:predicted small lipoprotein YifL